MDKHEYKLLNKNTLSKRTLNRQVGIVSHAGHMPYYNLRNIYMFLEKSFRHCDYYDLLSPENLYKILVKMAPWLPREGDPVFLVLVFLILTSDNPFTKAASEGRTINPLTLAIAKRELESLEVIARTGAKRVFDIFSMTKACQPLEFDGISVCDEPCERTPLPEFQRMLDLFASPVAWGNHIPELERWHRKWGYGVGIHHLAFNFENDSIYGFDFTPLFNTAIPHPSDFIGYEDERTTIRENTRRFVEGLPAHDMLLYGDRGTGKSSTIKLMLREFSGQGLRMIATDNNVKLLTELFSTVRNHRWKYILFIDDISFESWQSSSALEFRSLIQGDLIDRPKNVIFYVTSNRRTIVRMETDDTESHSSKLSAEDRQEILALSDRFGVKIWFQTPTQEQYLDIVRGLARQYGIAMAEDELVGKALQWERWNNVRSPRTAHQFIRSLVTTPLPD